MRKVLALMAVSLFCVSSASADVLVDQYDADPTLAPNGYSHTDGTAGFGPRFLLDDADTGGDIWVLEDFHFRHVWNSFTVPSGQGLVLSVWGDNGGAPDPNNVIAVANITNYMEMAYGGQAFGREIMETWVDFDPITVQGRFWFHAAIIGAENNFWLATDTINGSESWVDYHDFNGLEPGTNIFGVPRDLQYQWTGYIVPEPSTLSILALGSVALIGFRRRR